MEEGADVWIIDFSYPRQTLIALKDHHPNLIVLDHHFSAESDLQGLDFCTFDMAQSGAVLAWDHFHPGEPAPLFVLYLQDRDLWRFELPGSREVSAAIGSYPLDFRIWAEWLKNPDLMKGLREEGGTCLRLKNRQVSIMANNHSWATFLIGAGSVEQASRWVQIVPLSHRYDKLFVPPGATRYTVPCSNATVFFSEVGERLLELHPDAPFAAYYFDRSDGQRQWGLRSRPDFDCSNVSRCFSGGGHRQASGFVQPL
jgi:oligoribonuclease NrnB/cAMP/cGMP phosphodiesterase (DHH superfamily)